MSTYINRSLTFPDQNHRLISVTRSPVSLVVGHN